MEPSGTNHKILVIGATGQQGGATTRQLLERGHPVRALVRDPGAPGALALAELGVELSTGDLDDTGSLRTAMEGVDGVFLALTMMVGHRISPQGVIDEERRGKAVAELAREMGIGHLVYSSLNGAGAESGIPYYESKAAIERHIHALGQPATVLRPVSFMDNFATYNRPAQSDGELTLNLAIPAELPMQLIAVEDIGAFAAIAFGDPGRYIGRTVELVGDVLTPLEIAETIASFTGQPTRFQQTPIERIRAFDEQLAQMFTYFNQHPAPVPDLEALRAEHPGLMTLRTWLEHTGWKP
ncbi:NmrA/HSCARG family protein [Nonomuraea sp. NPDC050556]|uniref:NmrA/HSCARG family protein n=1 Tax=Nonomuraea sp. NPDC050556 TaxID=3364369 RepID=UPI003794F957